MADTEMHYDHLAAGLKEALENDKSAFDADRLQKYTGTECMVDITYSFHQESFFCETIWTELAKRIKIHYKCLIFASMSLSCLSFVLSKLHIFAEYHPLMNHHWIWFHWLVNATNFKKSILSINSTQFSSGNYQILFCLSCPWWVWWSCYECLQLQYMYWLTAELIFHGINM